MNTASFDCLSRRSNMGSHLVLEASAGTGKTFAIQHIVVRLLLKREYPLKIQQVLVVTFTRAAVKELKERIWRCIVQSLDDLHNQSNHAPDYLLEVIERGEEAIQDGVMALTEALLCFEDASIFTIHGFCERILREYGSGRDCLIRGEDSRLTQLEKKAVILDFIRTGFRTDRFLPSQIKAVFGLNGFSPESLQMQLLQLIDQGVEIPAGPALQEQIDEFQKVLSEFKQLNYNHKDIEEAFFQLAPYYKEICNQAGEIKEEKRKELEEFTALFFVNQSPEKQLDCFVQTSSSVLTLFCDRNAKKKKVPPDLDSKKEIIELIQSHFKGIFDRFAKPETLLLRAAHFCQKKMHAFQRMEEKFVPDDFMKRVAVAMSDASFSGRIRNAFQHVIIDEFQDTDPLQWTVFSYLFLEENRSIPMTLVGDPKQSIYRFRQADVYTYLQATRSLGTDSSKSLRINFRSDPELVDSVNKLLDSNKHIELIPLPKWKETLDVPSVESGARHEPLHLNDGKKAVHFFLVNGELQRKRKWPTDDVEEKFFSRVAHEILDLKRNQQIEFRRWAILVKDRFQAKRLSDSLKEAGIPVLTQKQQSLIDSPAYKEVKGLLDAALFPHDEAAVKKVLGGRLIGWTDKDLLSLNDERWIQICLRFVELNQTLIHAGPASFFDTFLELQLPLSDDSILETILRHEGGEILYHGLKQIFEILIDELQESWNPFSLNLFLDRFHDLEQSHDERMLLRQDQSQDAVQILTIHMSKGLEFDFVVPLGLIHRSPIKDKFFVNEQELVIREDHDPRWIEHLREIEAEKMRQLYVAMTRAKHRLYLPVAIQTDLKNEIPEGESSPMELYFNTFRNDYSDWISFLKDHPTISYEELTEVSTVERWNQEIPKTIKAPLPYSIQTYPEQLLSFSSLSKSTSSDDLIQWERPHDFDAENKTFHTLPAGTKTGILIHEILERLRFSAIRSAQSSNDIRSLIQPFLKGTLYEDWLDVISEMVYLSMNLPISIDGKELVLSTVLDEECYREMHFQYAADRSFGTRLNKEDFLQGIVDLLFQWNGRYYLLDWKTNWLGPEAIHYGQEALVRAMEHHDYFLQAKLYEEAFSRYLRLVDQRPFQECFGGSIYLFLRGPAAYIVPPGGTHGK